MSCRSLSLAVEPSTFEAREGITALGTFPDSSVSAWRNILAITGGGEVTWRYGSMWVCGYGSMWAMEHQHIKYCCHLYIVYKLRV